MMESQHSMSFTPWFLSTGRKDTSVVVRVRGKADDRGPRACKRDFNGQDWSLCEAADSDDSC